MIPSAVKENDRVILKRENNSKICRVVLGRKLNVGREKFHLDGLMGQVYGASFRVEKDQLIKVLLEDINSLTLTDESKECGKGEDDSLGNRHLLDDQENQKMGREEIAGLKKQGVTGEAIVEELVRNSKTFNSKTEFSKQKYIRRKNKKHLTTFTLLACNTRNLLEMYYNKGPTKICNLRMDSLAQVLNGGNVMSGGRYVVVDGCSGLLTGALLERLDGTGLVVNMYSGSAPSRPAVDLGYNFSPGQLSILKDFPLTHLNMLAPVFAMLQQQHRGHVVQQKAEQDVQQHQQQERVEIQEEIEQQNYEEKISLQKHECTQQQQQTQQSYQQQQQQTQQSYQQQQQQTQQSYQQQQQQTQQSCQQQQQQQTQQSYRQQQHSQQQNYTEQQHSSSDHPDKSLKVDECKEVEDDDDDDDDDANSDDNGGRVNTINAGDEKNNNKDGRKIASKRKVVPSSKRGKRNPETLEERKERRMKRRRELNEIKETIEESSMDGVLICTRGHLTPLTTTLLTLLKPGRPLVIFSQYREPLIDCYSALKKGKQVLMLKMSETWLRQYQILENRSHPLVNMSGSGGFIMTGIKVEAS